MNSHFENYREPKICAKWRLPVQSSNDREVIYPNRMRYFLSASCVWQLQLFLSWIMWLTVLYLLSLCLIFLFGLQWCFSANRLITVTCHWIQMESKKHGSTRTVQSSQLNELTVTIRKKTITKKKNASFTVHFMLNYLGLWLGGLKHQ